MNENIKSKLKENFDVALEGGATLMAGMLSDALIGQVVPGVVTTYLSYKQKRSEKMMINALDEIKKRIDSMDAALNKLSKEQIKFVKEITLPILLDNIIDEEQEEKIKLFINGYEKIITDKIFDENKILGYYDIIHSLRIEDIHCLLKYKGQDWTPATDKKNAGKVYSYEAYILNKLHNMGLLEFHDFFTDSVKDISQHRVSLSDFGLSFVSFFGL